MGFDVWRFDGEGRKPRGRKSGTKRRDGRDTSTIEGTIVMSSPVAPIGLDKIVRETDVNKGRV